MLYAKSIIAIQFNLNWFQVVTEAELRQRFNLSLGFSLDSLI